MDAVDDLRKQFDRLFSDSGLKPELERRLKQQLEVWLNKLNLVSREEFDAQTKVLAAAHAQLAHLRQQIQELKSQQEKQ